MIWVQNMGREKQKKNKTNNNKKYKKQNKNQQQKKFKIITSLKAPKTDRRKIFSWKYADYSRDTVKH